jgi:hypothetical protein
MSTHHRACATATVGFLALLVGGTSYPQRSTALAQLPIELTDGYIRVKLRVNDSEALDFIFDTGATRTIIDSVTAARIGLVAAERTRNNGQGRFVERIIEGVTLSAGRLVLEELELLQRSSERMELSLGVNIDGVIGADLLRDYVIEIHYDDRLLAIFDSGTYVYTGTGNRWDIEANQYFSLVTAEIGLGDGEILVGRYLIDTGAGLPLALNTPFVNDNNLLERIGARHLAYILRAQDVAMSSHPGRVPHFKLGGYQFDSLPVLLSQTEAGPLSPSAIAGIIGNRIWRRFNTVYDYGRDRIYLEPNEFFDDPFSIDCSGLSVTSTTGGTVVIRQVLEGSPSAKAGVMPDDEIISINGSSVADYSLSDIRRLLTQDSQIVNLTLKRNGTVKELSFRLRQLY